jgi:tryptophan synthase alpha chain
LRSPLEARLRARIASGGKALVVFLTAGYPDEERFLAAARAAVAAGVDALEIGIPFSDPLADGPTIQRTSQSALERGVTLTGTLDLLREHGASIGVPTVLMTYMNPVHAMGAERFCARAAEAGVSGVLVSDLPPEEMPILGSALRAHRLDRIVLIAPTSRPERIARLLPAASGFVYCVTRTGVTGAGGDFSSRLGEQVAQIRAASDLPVVAGFGIRAAADVERLRSLVDGVVIGARLLELLESARDVRAIDSAVRDFLQPIREALGP